MTAKPRCRYGRASEAQTGPWREQLLLTLTHWGAIFGGVIAIGVTIRALAFNFVDVSHPAFAAMFVGYGAIVALRLLPGLPYLLYEQSRSRRRASSLPAALSSCAVWHQHPCSLSGSGL